MQRATVLGGTFVWATPVVQSLASPALASGTKPNDISYLAVLIRCASNGFTAWYRMKWDTTTTGALMLQTGSSFRLPGSSDPLLPPDGSPVAGGSAPGTGATYEADGSITITLGSDCTLVDFVVKRGLCAAGPGVAGEPSAGQTGGTVRFPGPTSNRASCA